MTPPPARSVALGAQAVRYAVAGPPDAARTLLVFNGIGAGVESLAPFIAAFERTRVVAFDVPGVGGSPAPLLPYRMQDIAGLAAMLLDHLGIASADVFGVSWGGAAAQEFAIHHAARCRTLTLAATSAGAVMVPALAGALLKVLVPQGRMDPVCMLQACAALYDGIARLQRDVLALQARAESGPTGPGYLYQLLAVWGWTSWHRLHRVHAPTLVLMGADDPIVPPINGRIVASRLRRATLESVDCGHLFVLTRPGETARRVERFMAEHAGAPGAHA
jgi:poly(3-hydroxyalkanoate) depolymerase